MLARYSPGVLPLSGLAKTGFTGRLFLCSAVACVAVFFWSVKPRMKWPSSSFAPSRESFNEAVLDQVLYRAATISLGDREGAVIMIDPQTGRIRAFINPQLAFEGTYSPGSTIKPFTALAAMRSGLIDGQSRTLCRENYSRDGFHTVCSHAKDLPPFNTAEAIAYSCNYYFGKLGERLNQIVFDDMLSEFGFGQRTGVNGINTERESPGHLHRGEWWAESALGEGNHLQVTPIQLLTAYSALVNGGHLFTPRIAQAKDFVPQLRATLMINDEQRSLIVEGMRGAVRYGTAERAKLHSLPLYIFGKTGTSTQTNGFRTQGWFVGFASAVDDGQNSESLSAPGNLKLAVLVFVKKAHGADAAEIARPIFEAYARKAQRDTETRGRGDTEKKLDANALPIPASPRRPVSASELLDLSPRLRVPVSSSAAAHLRISGSVVRVHLGNENLTRTMSLEDYVLGVVAAEGSTESEPEALKALAVAARTYALKNLGRHAREGYAFCTTTHCQRYRRINSLDAGSQVSSVIVDAVKETMSEVLHDNEGQIVDSYFSASCGGATANISALWGVKAPSYLRGVGDDYCLTMPHRKWTDVISSTNLRRALQSDPRTDVGENLVDVVVTRRDATGRAELITIEGEGQRTVSGWDFKIIVGRALGWNLLKSSRFEIARSGVNFVFRGSGFGHGLGLCQEGAHVMAQRGASYRQILAKYFPTTGVMRDTQTRGSGERETGRLTAASEHFRISYPARERQRGVTNLIATLESARANLIGRVAIAGIPVQLSSLEIFINETTGDFVGRTGQPWWAAAATKGNRIDLQPVELLERRGILETTLRHEVAHAVIDALGRGHTPRWLAEGLALYGAGEGPMVSRYGPRSRVNVEEIERDLTHARTLFEMRAAYAAAYCEVKHLINAEGEARVWQCVAQGRN
jgi:stage II sporulation protein D